MSAISTNFVALNTPTYKLAKFLVPILKPLTTNEFTVKDSFHFAEEIVHENNWFEHCPVEYRPLYYHRYIDDIFVLVNSAEHLKTFL